MSDFNKNLNYNELLEQRRKERIKEEKKEKIKKLSLNALKWIGVLVGSIIIIGMLVVSMILSKFGTDIVELFVDGKQRVENVTKETFNSRQPTRVYDKDGNVIYEYKESSYIYTELEDLNPYVMKGFMAAEDARFLSHSGMDYIGTTRAILNTLSGADVQGGSSITQQLSKNVFLTQEKTIDRKIKELVIASNLERRFTKEEIFEFYVNNIYYGYGCYSFESASQYYFQKTNKDLTLGEVATLVGVINNPTQFDPIRKPENARKKRDRVLFRMRDEGYITKEQYEAEIAKDIQVNPGKRDLDNTIKDDMVSYAIDCATEIFMEKNGFQFQYSFESTDERKEYWQYYNEEYKACRNALLTGGYEIHTVTDTKLNSQIQEIANKYMKQYTAKNANGVYKKQVSLTAIDNKTGKVVAMVGGRGQENDQLNRAYQAARQPGSAIKPLVAYAPIFERGQIPSSVMVDAAIENGPKNSTNTFAGPVTLRTALEKSINTIPYKIASSIGGDTALSYLENMKFQTLTHTDKNPIIAVGGFTKGVTTEEMASGFSTLARNGEYLNTNNITKIVKTNTKEVIYDEKQDQETVGIYDDGASYLTTDAMKGVLTQGTGTAFKPNYPYVAGKTGTTNMQKDRWMVGYTPYHTVAVWVGEDTPKAQSGVNAQGYIWRDTIDLLSKGKKVVDFEKPESVSTYKGQLVNDIYLNKKDTSATKRKNSEKNRIKEENAIHKERLSNEDYRIVHGLTKEEEIRRENEAERVLISLEEYILTSKSQFEELDSLLSMVKEKIELVKHENAYKKYMSRYNTAKRKLDSIKNQILNPPVIETPAPEIEDESNGDVVVGESENSNNNQNNGDSGSGNSNNGDIGTVITPPTTNEPSTDESTNGSENQADSITQ